MNITKVAARVVVGTLRASAVPDPSYRAPEDPVERIDGLQKAPPSGAPEHRVERIDWLLEAFPRDHMLVTYPCRTEMPTKQDDSPYLGR